MNKFWAETTWDGVVDLQQATQIQPEKVGFGAPEEYAIKVILDHGNWAVLKNHSYPTKKEASKAIGELVHRMQECEL